MAKALTALFLAASVMAGTAAAADAAPMSKCRNNPVKFSRFHGKCLSDKRIEKIQERRGGGGEDHHGANHQ
jgi:hypothetical protein